MDSQSCARALNALFSAGLPGNEVAQAMNSMFSFILGGWINNPTFLKEIVQECVKLGCEEDKVLAIIGRMTILAAEESSATSATTSVAARVDGSAKARSQASSKVSHQPSSGTGSKDDEANFDRGLTLREIMNGATRMASSSSYSGGGGTRMMSSSAYNDGR